MMNLLKLKSLGLIGIFVLMGGSGTAMGQTSSGSYTVGGCTVNWEFNFGFRSGYSAYRVWYLEGFEPVIEGPGVELERESEELPKEVERVGDYQVLDYGRDLMSGRFMRDFEKLAQKAEDAGLEPLQLMSRDEMTEEITAAYGMHLLDHPEDWLVVREMGVALLRSGRTEDAMNMVHEAYAKNPELGILPLNRTLLGESEEPLRLLVVRAVQHTNREPSAEGWLMVAVLMQAQGRIELAGEMLDRAEGLGLDPTIVEGFRESLP